MHKSLPDVKDEERTTVLYRKQRARPPARFCCALLQPTNFSKSGSHESGYLRRLESLDATLWLTTSAQGETVELVCIRSIKHVDAAAHMSKGIAWPCMSQTLMKLLVLQNSPVHHRRRQSCHATSCGRHRSSAPYFYSGEVRSKCLLSLSLSVRRVAPRLNILQHSKVPPAILSNPSCSHAPESRGPPP